MTHVLAVAAALSAALLLSRFPVPRLVCVFFALVFGPGVFCNALFHFVATIRSRHYCAGVITALLVYVPLSVLLTVLALREGLLSTRSGIAAILVAAVFHTLEVGHTVFKRW